MVQGKQSWEDHVWFCNETEEGDERWIARSSELVCLCCLS